MLKIGTHFPNSNGCYAYHLLQINLSYILFFNFSKSSSIDSPTFEIYENKSSNITVVNKDSLEACQGLDNPFVLIFASAKKPGGGVRTGANAQEEA